jgi:hypothetical protein
MNLAQRLSYALPLGLVGILSAWLHLAWWSTAMLVGGTLFALGYLWGDRRVQQRRHGLLAIAVGLALLGAAFGLAWRLGIGLDEFQAIRRQHTGRHSGQWLYQLPGLGVGVLTYGLVVWSRAWARDGEVC